MRALTQYHFRMSKRLCRVSLFPICCIPTNLPPRPSTSPQDMAKKDKGLVWNAYNAVRIKGATLSLSLDA